MRYGFIVIALFFLFAPSANAATWYVRPAEGTYGSENGTSYANAYKGFGDISWGSGSVNAGDTLYVCGSFDLDSVDGGAPMMQVDASGSATGTLTINGDCSGQGDLSQAIIDGEGSRTRGIDSGSAQKTYVTLRNMLIKNFTSAGVLVQGTNTNFSGWRFENVDIQDIRGATADGFNLRGTYNYIDENSSMTNIGEDAVYTEGDNFTAKATCTNPSLDSVTGDCFQMDKEADNFLYDGVRCYHTTDAKQCVFVSTTGFTGSGIVRNSYCDGPSATATLHTCFFFEDLNGTVFFTNNYGKESRYLAYAGATTTLIARGNVGRDFSARGIQCGTQSTTCTTANNTISNASTCFSTEVAIGTNVIANNIAHNCTVGIQKNVGDTESGNVVWGATSNVQNESADTGFGYKSTSTDPLFLGGASPSTLNGFRLTGTSTLTAGGVHIGNYTDITGKPFEYTPSIGAFQFGARDFIRNRTAR